MKDFTQRKFLGLLPTTRHKKCGELVRTLYLRCASGENVESLLECYEQWQQWNGDAPLDDATSLQQLSQRYHYHLSLAGISLREHNLLPRVVRHGDKAAGAAPWPIAVYLEDLRSAHNVGSIIRTVEAFALGTVVLSGMTPDPSTCKGVADAAMGSHEWVTIVSNSEEKWRKLPRPLIALETDDNAIALGAFTFPESFTLAVGNEEYGCSNELIAAADVVVQIPLRGRKNSLNVANALACAAHEIARQRTLP